MLGVPPKNECWLIAAKAGGETVLKEAEGGRDARLQAVLENRLALLVRVAVQLHKVRRPPIVLCQSLHSTADSDTALHVSWQKHRAHLVGPCEGLTWSAPGERGHEHHLQQQKWLISGQMEACQLLLQCCCRASQQHAAASGKCQDEQHCCTHQSAGVLLQHVVQVCCAHDLRHLAWEAVPRALHADSSAQLTGS